MKCRFVVLAAAASMLLVTVLVIVPASASAHRMKVCRATSYEDLKAKHINCDTARGVYRASHRHCTFDNMEGTRCVGSFRYRGLRWRCRAYNTSIYTWRCTASGDRVMRYRWLTGD